MARRRRFTREEHEAFTAGVTVEWQNGTHWHPGIISGPAFRDDVTGAWHVVLINHATTRTVSKGDVIWGSPGKVRLRQAS